VKVSCLQENFIKGLSIVEHSTGKESGLPILSSILIKTEHNLIQLSATNLEIGITCVIRGKIEKEGSVAVNGKLLNDFINLLPKEKIDIDVDENFNLKITCKNFSTIIHGVNPEDFPIIPKIEKKEIYTTKLQYFKKALQNTVYTAIGNETRPELNGLLFLYKKGQKELCVVGTNAIRLAEVKLSLHTPATQDNSCIIPLKTIQELLRILPNEYDGNIEWFLNENQIVFLYEEVEVISKQIQGEYPDYTQIIPKTFSSKITIPLDEYKKAVKAASIFSKTNLYDVTCTFRVLNTGGAELEVASKNTSLGENNVVFPVELQGEENTLILNYKYLLDGLNIIEDSHIIFNCIDTLNPCVITPLHQQGFIYLLMPIRE